MKNFFTNIIEKTKNFVESLTPTAKLRYIVISVVTIVVVASLLIAVSLNTSKPEIPINPEDFETGETATIDFDNEIVFDIGGESSSVGTTDVTTEDPSVTTDEVSGTEKNTFAEESTNVQTENNTESTDEPEPKPTDPSQDYNPDPQPEDTTNTPVVNPKPTETTTQTQTTPKPTETTNKAPQTEPKPTETTTAHQTQPKPTETTTKTPQTEPKPTETTKPQESEPQPAGQFSLKEKKYDYNGANVTILQVENKSQQVYTIKITGKFKDANGNIVKTESKTFEGFPAGWSNYFVFQPGVKYSSVTWGMETSEYKEVTVAQYLHAANKVVVNTFGVLSDGKGSFIAGAPTDFSNLDEYVSVTGNATGYYHTYDGILQFVSDVVFFDSNGNIYLITTLGKSNLASVDTEGRETALSSTFFVTNVLWKNRDQYNLPNELKNMTVISGFKSVSEY